MFRTNKKFVASLLISSFISTQLPLTSMAAADTNMSQKSIYLNGKKISNPYGFAYDGTTYMPIWYVMKALENLGITSDWDGHRWNLTTPSTYSVDLSNIQPGQAPIRIYLNGTLIQNSPGIVKNDPYSGAPTTFVPIWYIMKILNRMNVESDWDGTNWNMTQNGSAKSAFINVPAVSQDPELYNGCEVTSLSMLLSAAGHPVDKMTLANEIPKDPTPIGYDSNGNIVSWGDPNVGFVGDITGKNPGYGVYHGPVYRLLNTILPGQAVDLTGSSFDDILRYIASGKPVVAWTTVTFSPTSSWVTWQGPNGPVRATFNEHAVLIVGFNDKQIFINNPLDGTAGEAVDRNQFMASWIQLGQQAVSFR
jgi:uncharacterized protein YvpB